MKPALNGHSHRLVVENEKLRVRLTEAEETLHAIRNGDVDAVIVNGRNGQKVYSLEQAENVSSPGRDSPRANGGAEHFRYRGVFQ